MAKHHFWVRWIIMFILYMWAIYTIAISRNSMIYPIYFQYVHYLSHILPLFKTMIPRKLSLPAPPCRHPPAADHRSPCRGQDSDRYDRFQPVRGMTTRTAMLGPALSIPDMIYIYIYKYTYRYIEIYPYTYWYTYTYRYMDIYIYIYTYLLISDISNRPIYLSIYLSACLSVCLI